MSDLRFEVEYPHPPEKVWRALTEREALAAWLMPNDFEPRVGHQFTLRTDPAPGFDGIVHCEVLTVDEPRRVSYTWRGGPLDTTVTFDLEPTANGTRLRFTQAGFKGFQAQLVRLILKSGFRGMYKKKLPAVLDRMGAVADLFGHSWAIGSGGVHGCDKRGLWRLLPALFGPILRRREGKLPKAD
jgi:uncharacterized protein YndB with AHSA1/START domain